MLPAHLQVRLPCPESLDTSDATDSERGASMLHKETSPLSHPGYQDDVFFLS